MRNPNDTIVLCNNLQSKAPVKKEDKRWTFVLPLSLGNPARHYSICRRVESTRKDIGK
jgi:hypothetical protein